MSLAKVKIHAAGQLLVESQPDSKAYANPELRYTVTARDLRPHLGVKEYLHVLFPFIKLDQVESLFGFTTQFSPLYGGRPYVKAHSMTNTHLEEMSEAGINVSLNLTNHFFSEKAYQATLPLLERHHQPGNSITCFNDELASRLRQDFPDYILKASIIKHLNSLERIQRALDCYDQVVLPMDKNHDPEFLEKLPEKKRITLFANASCAYNCMSRSCYVGFSQEIQGMPVTSECSIPVKKRENLGKIFFDVKTFHALGFRQMKLIPPYTQRQKKQRLHQLQEHKTWWFYKRAKEKNTITIVASYPKSGRTYLRYFLAQYVAKLYQFDLDIDLLTMFSLFPNNSDCDGLKGKAVLNTYYAGKLPVVLFDHAQVWRDDGQKRILLLRGLLDTLVSEYFHFSQHMKETHADIGEYLLKDKTQGVMRLCEYLNQIPKDFSGLLITYEQLVRQPGGSFESVLQYLGLPIDKQVLNKSLALSCFESMSSMEEQSPVPGMEYNIANPQARRMRRGKISGYRDYLDDDLIYDIRQVCEKYLDVSTKQWLEAHRLWPIEIT